MSTVRPFDYEKALKEHVEQERGEERGRAEDLDSAAEHLLWYEKLQKKKRKQLGEPEPPKAKGKRQTLKALKQKRQLDSAGDSDIEDRDLEEHFLHGDDSASFDGGEIKPVAPRSKSARVLSQVIVESEQSESEKVKQKRMFVTVS